MPVQVSCQNAVISPSQKNDMLLAVNGQPMKMPKDIAAFRSMQINVPLHLQVRWLTG